MSDQTFKKKPIRVQGKEKSKGENLRGRRLCSKEKRDHIQPQGKLGPMWDGPYKVTSAQKNRSYTLETIEGRPIPRTWNTKNLKRFHF